MVLFKTEREIIFGVVFFVFLVVYLYFISFFISENIVWVFPVVVYLLLFIIKDIDLHEKAEKENLKPKNLKEIRIDFY